MCTESVKKNQGIFYGGGILHKRMDPIVGGMTDKKKKYHEW